MENYFRNYKVTKVYKDCKTDYRVPHQIIGNIYDNVAHGPTMANLGACGGGWSTPRPGRFTQWKETRYPFYRRLGGPQCRLGRVWQISPPPKFDPRTVQPLASRHTDYAIPAL
jgi:hypothetical protein